MKLRIAETVSVETAELPDLGRQPATTCASAHHTTPPQTTTLLLKKGQARSTLPGPDLTATDSNNTEKHELTSDIRPSPRPPIPTTRLCHVRLSLPR